MVFLSIPLISVILQKLLGRTRFYQKMIRMKNTNERTSEKLNIVIQKLPIKSKTVNKSIKAPFKRHIYSNSKKMTTDTTILFLSK